MKLRSITTRTAVAGAVTALAAGALVGATAPANAASASTDYQCTSPVGDLGTFPVTIDVPLLPPTAVAGFKISAGLLTYNGKVVVPAQTAALLGQFGVDGANADDFTFAIGSSVTVKAPGTYEAADAPNEDGSVDFDGTGANLDFNLPKAGTYSVDLPKSFTFTPTSGGNALPVTATCTAAAPGSLGKVTLSKQTSTITAKAATKQKINVVVKNEYSTPTGKVVAKLGKKSYSGTLKSGKATIQLPKSAKGKKVTVSYKGDGYTQAAKTSVKVK